MSPHRIQMCPDGVLRLLPDHAESRRIAARIEAEARQRAERLTWWRKLRGKAGA